MLYSKVGIIPNRRPLHAENMILAIGLGNPGNQYEKTRHNLGREILLAFAKKHEFAEPLPDPKLKALIAQGSIAGQKYILVAPETFMNKSGEAAKLAARQFKAKPEQVFVVHDDADIPFGNTKLSFNRDSAGHKGVESVMRALGTKKFWRFRVGIGAPQSRIPQKKFKDRKGKKPKHIPAEQLVLKKFTPAEETIAKKVRAKTIGALGELAKEPPEKVMNHYNK